MAFDDYFEESVSLGSKERAATGSEVRRSPVNLRQRVTLRESAPCPISTQVPSVEYVQWLEERLIVALVREQHRLTAAHFTEQTRSTQDPPTPEPGFEVAYQAINRLERIGVYDYDSCVRCLRENFKLVFGDDSPLTDPQDMIQKLAAEVQNARRTKDA